MNVKEIIDKQHEELGAYASDKPILVPDNPFPSLEDEYLYGMLELKIFEFTEPVVSINILIDVGSRPNICINLNPRSAFRSFNKLRLNDSLDPEGLKKSLDKLGFQRKDPWYEYSYT